MRRTIEQAAAESNHYVAALGSLVEAELAATSRDRSHRGPRPRASDVLGRLGLIAVPAVVALVLPGLSSAVAGTVTGIGDGAGWPAWVAGGLGPLASGAMATTFPPLDGSAPKTQQFAEAPEMGIDPAKRYTATLDTSLGEIVIALDALKAPKTVNNFVFLALHHYYDGVIFHRIINGFMCQGGDPTGTGRGGPGYKFEDELPKPREYQIGSVAMANAGPHTNGSQFFLVSGSSGVGLPPQYSLFGQIVKGLDVLDTMQNVPTGGGDKPKTDVVINSVAITVADD